MPKIKVNGVDVYYELHGDGQPVVLIGGFTCDTLFWMPILEQLAHHFQVLLFDNRGAGQSENPDGHYTVKDMAADAVALITHLGLKRPHVIGHSMGGCIGQTIAFQQPDLIDRLVLCNSLIKADRRSAFLWRFLLHLRQQETPQRILIEAVMPWLLSEDFFRGQEKVEQFIRLSLEQPHPQSLTGFSRQLTALLAFDSNEWFEKIQVPTFVVYGEQDILCPNDSKRLAEKIKGAKSKNFEAMGHLVPIELPDAFSHCVVEFLHNKYDQE